MPFMHWGVIEFIKREAKQFLAVFCFTVSGFSILP